MPRPVITSPQRKSRISFTQEQTHGAWCTMRSMTRRASMWIALSVGVVIGLVGMTAFLVRDPTPRFVERRSSLVCVVTSPTTVEDGYVYSPVRLIAKSGLAVD